MRLIGRERLKRIGDDVDRWLRSWCVEVIHAHWKRLDDVTEQFPNALVRPNGDILFPIGSSGYSVELQVAFHQRIALILGIHKDHFLHGS